MLRRDKIRPKNNPILPKTRRRKRAKETPQRKRRRQTKSRGGPETDRQAPETDLLPRLFHLPRRAPRIRPHDVPGWPNPQHRASKRAGRDNKLRKGDRPIAGAKIPEKAPPDPVRGHHQEAHRPGEPPRDPERGAKRDRDKPVLHRRAVREPLAGLRGVRLQPLPGARVPDPDAAVHGAGDHASAELHPGAEEEELHLRARALHLPQGLPLQPLARREKIGPGGHRADFSAVAGPHQQGGHHRRYEGGHYQQHEPEGQLLGLLRVDPHRDVRAVQERQFGLLSVAFQHSEPHYHEGAPQAAAHEAHALDFEPAFHQVDAVHPQGDPQAHEQDLPVFRGPQQDCFAGYFPRARLREVEDFPALFEEKVGLLLR